MSKPSVQLRAFLIIPLAFFSLAGVEGASAQGVEGAAPAAHGGATTHAQSAAKPVTAQKPKVKVAPQASAEFDIIPCADAKGVVHKCIRIDPAAGEVNDTSRGASYRMIYGH